tara:strand:+ start:102 stop:287 length:186 start_codon:yes stop_codon:yes gene_type:complete
LEGNDLEVMYKMCLGLMFFLIVILFISHIFYQTPNYNQDLTFSFEEMILPTEDIVAIVHEE